jgi:hypothetical protein
LADQLERAQEKLGEKDPSRRRAERERSRARDDANQSYGRGAGADGYQQRPSYTPPQSGGATAGSDADAPVPGWPGWLKWTFGLVVTSSIYWMVSSHMADQEWEAQKTEFSASYASAKEAIKASSPQGIAELKSALPKMGLLSSAVKVDEDQRRGYLKSTGCYGDVYSEHPSFEQCFVGSLFLKAFRSDNGDAMKLLYAADPDTIAYEIRSYKKRYAKGAIDLLFSTLMTTSQPSPEKWELGNLLIKNGANSNASEIEHPGLVEQIRAQNPPSDFMAEVEQQAKDHVLDIGRGGSITAKGLQYIQSQLGVTDVKLTKGECYYSRDIENWKFTARKGKESGTGCIIPGSESKERLWYETIPDAKAAMIEYMREEDGITEVRFHGNALPETAREKCDGPYSLALNFTARQEGIPVTGTVCRTLGVYKAFTNSTVSVDTEKLTAEMARQGFTVTEGFEKYNYGPGLEFYAKKDGKTVWGVVSEKGISFEDLKFK